MARIVRVFIFWVYTSPNANVLTFSSSAKACGMVLLFNGMQSSLAMV